MRGSAAALSRGDAGSPAVPPPPSPGPPRTAGTPGTAGTPHTAGTSRSAGTPHTAGTRRSAGTLRSRLGQTGPCGCLLTPGWLRSGKRSLSPSSGCGRWLGAGSAAPPGFLGVLAAPLLGSHGRVTIFWCQGHLGTRILLTSLRLPRSSLARCGLQTNRRCAGRYCLAVDKTSVGPAWRLGSRAQGRSGTQTRAFTLVICKYRQRGTFLTTLPRSSVSYS